MSMKDARTAAFRKVSMIALRFRVLFGLFCSRRRPISKLREKEEKARRGG